MQSTEWRPVVGYEGIYAVSDVGQVMRVLGGVHGATPGRILKQRIHENGYYHVGLHNLGSRRTVTVHSLVAESFHGSRPGGQHARHRNGIKTDNRAENLEWGTRSENMLDAVGHGTHFSKHRGQPTCKRGHGFSVENTYVNSGRRHCRTCQRERAKAHRRAV